MHSNAPWAGTGYGQQTALFAPRFVRAGHEVAISAFYGLHGASLRWEGIEVLPGAVHPYGLDIIEQHATRWIGDVPGVVVTLVDVWIFDAQVMRRLPVACWTPIDHDPAPPGVLRFLRESNVVPIAMSEFGRRHLVAEGFDPLYVPHGVDTVRLQPEPDRAEVKRQLGVDPDCFLVGMVAANKGWPARKGWPQAFAGFKLFHERHRDSAMWVHTTLDSRYGGPDLGQIVGAMGMADGPIHAPDQYALQTGRFGPDFMARMYSAFDVLLNPAYGEGFGVPIIEAQACGTPVIVTDATAMTELAGSGWLLAGRRWWTEQGSWQFVPEPEDIAAKLEDAYTRAPRMRDRAREFAVAYDADVVMRDFWSPTLRVVESRVAGTVEPEHAIADGAPNVVSLEGVSL